MSEIKKLARGISAAGSTIFPSDGANHLLYVEESSLVSRVYEEDTVEKTEPIADDDVRPDSVAVYLLPSPDKRLVVCISESQSVLRALTYDPDMNEWDEDEKLAARAHTVHAQGNLAGVFDQATGKRHLVFQNTSGDLVHVDDAWVGHTISVKPTIGTPLCMTKVNGPKGNIAIFYVCAADHCLHIATQIGQQWDDQLLSDYVLEKENPKRLIVTYGGKDRFSAFVLTHDGKLFEINHEGKKMELGSVGEEGEWVPATKEQACYIFTACYCVRYIYWCGCWRGCWC